MTAGPAAPGSRTGWRATGVLVLGWAPAAAVATSAAAWWDRLPRSVATHWSSLGGPPDGFSSRTAVLGATLVVAALGAVLVTGALRRDAAGSARARALVGAGTAAAGAAAGTWLALAGAAAGAPDPGSTRLGVAVLLTLAGLAWGVPAALLLGPARTTEDFAPGTGPRLPLGPTELAAWSARSTSRPLLAASAASVVVVVVVATGVPAVWPVLVVPAVVLLLLARVDVTVDRRGLRVVAGVLRVPVRRVRLEDVVQARAAQVRARDWGGWGYRVGPGRSALVLRSGPGVVLDLVGGRRFAVTLDRPEVPAALLNTLRDQARARG